MKSTLLFTIILLTTICNAQIVTIPDANFKAKLLSASTTNGVASTQNPDINGWVYTSNKIDTNNDGEIQTSEISAIRYLNLNNAGITNLEGIGSFTNLRALSFNDNQVSNVDTSALINLKWLLCNNNLLTSLNLLNSTNLYELRCENNQLTSLNLQGLAALKNLFCKSNQLSSLNIQGNIVLEHLDFRFNQVATINLQGLTGLRVIYCGNNQITSLNLQGLNLWQLHCSNNLLTSLNLQNINFYELDFSNNSISQINLQGLTNLHRLTCTNNQLTELNLQGLINLQDINCGYNQLTSLNLQGLTKLSELYCNNNQLTELDSQYSSYSGDINCSNNQLVYLFIKNGSNQVYVNFANNPNIQYICCDYNYFSIYNSEYDEIVTKIYQYGLTNCHVNSYCSFTPGGTFYTITGSNKFDENANGCDASDAVVPNLKFNISNGSVSGSFINDNSGITNFPVQAGTHTLTPAFENPSYFTATPPSVTVSFPSAASPFTQDFCFSANGTHPDLEIIAIPYTPIVHAGSNVIYKIIYKNKGTMTQSGTVNLLYNDAVLDLVLASPAVDNVTTNNLNWNFSNLLPFETREIFVTLETNSPIDNPPLNTGYYLNYTATVSSAAIDDTADDNVFEFRQVVDTDCGYNYMKNIQESDITPDDVGKYAYYMIGIENTGSASKQNIVVKNQINASKFDVSTLQVIETSHECNAKITSSGKVEFVFENINLPFAPNANRGYIVYKIKTKSNLAVGDTFSNSANVYFDYDFPIPTNNVTTTVVSTLNLEEINDLNIDLSFSPNPVKNMLQFKGNEKVDQIEVYDIAGRIVSSNFVSENSVDLSHLKIGYYILKVFTEKGTINTKIIKE